MERGTAGSAVVICPVCAIDGERVFFIGSAFLPRRADGGRDGGLTTVLAPLAFTIFPAFLFQPDRSLRSFGSGERPLVFIRAISKIRGQKRAAIERSPSAVADPAWSAAGGRGHTRRLSSGKPRPTFCKKCVRCSRGRSLGWSGTRYAQSLPPPFRIISCPGAAPPGRFLSFGCTGAAPGHL